MAKRMTFILGIAFIAIGVAGFVIPGLLGTHLGLAHNLVHIISGIVALSIAARGSMRTARIFCLTFGGFYFLLGVVGFVIGQPGLFTMPGMHASSSDSDLFKVIPGVLELGARDHALHIALGLLFLVAGVATQKTVKTPETREDVLTAKHATVRHGG